MLLLSVLSACLLSSAWAQPGPRLTDQQLFDALNLDYPGLGQVKADVAASNLAAAKADLTGYLIARTNVNWFFDWRHPTTVSFNRSAADLTTNGYVNQIGYSYTFPGGNIDWWYNYTTNPVCGCVKNNEWQWQLNRMTSWPNLGQTYWGTRDESYAQCWSRQLRDWISDCPAATARANGAPSTWRTIEAGIRMSGAWPDAFFRFVLSPSLTNNEHVLYLKSCIEHGRYLTNFYTSENFLTMEMNGLFTIGVTFPELKEAAGWRSFAARTLYGEQTNQFLPDGVHNELTARYHGVAVDNIANLYDVAQANSRLAELPAGYLARLEKSFDFYLNSCTPNRVTPDFNDSGRESVRSWLNTGLQYFPSRTDYRWLASNGASGAPPAFVSCRFPYAGYAVMRSGWETNANYLCLDAGALGYSGHRHEDKLNLVLWANGREFLFDNGGGPYDTSIWRVWGQSSYSHNCVVVDNLDQEGGDGSATVTDPDYVAQAPIDMRWESDLYHDFAAGVYNRGFGGNYNNRPAAQTRRVLFVKPDLFLVADTLVPNNASNHTYQARWHLRTTNTLYTPNGMMVTTTDAGQPNLAVVPCLGSGLLVGNVHAQTSATLPGTTNLAEILGWDLPDTTSSLLPATTVTHTRSGTGTQQFLTLFLPLAAGATNPVQQIVSTGPTAADLWLNDGRRLQVYADPNPARGLKLTEILADGTTNRYVGAGFAPPVLGGLSNRVMNPNTVKTVHFTVSDPDGSAGNVVLTAHSLNPSLVPDAGLVLSGSGSNRVLTITPAGNASGSARIVLNASDLDGSTVSPDFLLTINSPPATNGTAAATWEEQPVTFDLLPLLADDLTAPGNLLLALDNVTGGTATLLADGHTVSFVPGTNFSGTAGLQVVSTDMGFDPRLLLYYSFEATNDLASGTARDDSGNFRNATLQVAGAGAAATETDVPAALGLANLQSLRLTESAGTNVASLARLVPTNEFNFNDHDWTFSGWFKRVSQTNDDFIFYIGDGDGFGSNEELQLHGEANSPTLSLRHYIGETNTDVSLSAGGIAIGQWHHAAITFSRTNVSAGILRLYVDGALAGQGAVPRFNLPQNVPVVFGGHNRAVSGQNRGFNGWLDDLAVFTVALPAEEIAQLAVRTVGHHAGLTATNVAAIAVRDINDPPTSAAGQLRTSQNQPGDIDLRTLVADPETPAALLRFRINSSSNGTATLLADGHTARFLPATNVTDIFASFSFSVTDMGVDPRAVLHYSFEPPDLAADGLAADNSGNGRDGALQSVGAGTYSFVTNVPPPLALYDTASLQVNESGTSSAARLSRLLPPAELDLSDSDWSFAGWFRRSSQANEDFIFYIGNGDGFGSNEELQLYGMPGAASLGLRHYIGESLTDVNFTCNGINAGDWHHTALTYTRTNSHTGILRWYVDGTLAGTAAPLFNLDQTAPVVFGGHNSSGFAVSRWFNGQLDDLVLFNAALSSNEIARLAAGTVGHFGGLSATNTVTVTVGTPSVPPLLAPIPDQVLAVGKTLSVATSAADPAVPPQRLLFSLRSAPVGATINSTNGLISWRPPIERGGFSNLFTVVVTQAGWETNLAPLADAYVRDGSLAGSNFGTDSVLQVRLSGVGFARESYLRFSLSNVVGSLAEARLQLSPVFATVAATHAVAFVTNNNWNELTLTWSNKPASGPALATWTPQSGVPTDLPLLASAGQALAGDKLLSLRIYATNSASDRIEYGSREGAFSNAPHLYVLSTNGPLLSAVQSFWVNVLPASKPRLGSQCFQNGRLHFTVTGDSGPDYTIQASTNLTDWLTVFATNSPAVPFEWNDAETNAYPQRYYRVRLGP